MHKDHVHCGSFVTLFGFLSTCRFHHYNLLDRNGTMEDFLWFGRKTRWVKEVLKRKKNRIRRHNCYVNKHNICKSFSLHGVKAQYNSLINIYMKHAKERGRVITIRLTIRDLERKQNSNSCYIYENYMKHLPILFQYISS